MEQSPKFYLKISNVSQYGEPLYDDILNSDLPQEEKVKQIQIRGQEYRDEVDRQKLKDYGRIGLGGLVSAVGALPIAITKNPVLGSAIGGGVYELGQGIMEGDEFPELMQRAGWGGAIGGTVGGAVSKLPDAARFVNNLSGGRIGQATSNLTNRLLENENVLRGYRTLNNALSQDVKWGVNPFKNTGEVLHNFIGENAFVAKGKLGEAQQMAMYGDSNADIRNATGWFKGVDGKWRYEIPDGKMIDNPKLVENFDEDIGTYYTGKLSDIYDAPELYQAYPQLANKDIVIQSMPDGYGGSSWGDSISINRNYFQKDNPEFLKLKAKLENTPEYKKYDLAFNTDTGDAVQDLANMDKAQKEFFDSDIGKQYHSLMWDKNYQIERKVQGFNDDALKTLVHETQHQIQGIEGFARGGHGERPDYWNLAGEVEARLAGARAKLTPEQRQIYNPANESSYLRNYGYDVVPEKQIVEFRNNESDLYNNLVNNNEIVKPPLKYRDKSVIMDGINYPELDLPKEEYAPLHSAFVRHIADAPKGTKIIVKPYGGYVYTAIIEDDLPRFIDKDYH